MTKNITIRDIIYSRIDFIENNNIFILGVSHEYNPA